MGAAITIEVLPATYGDAIWIECARDGRPWRMVVDGGPPEAAGALAARVDALPPGERTIDVVVVSHIDSDHIGGMLPLLERDDLDIGDVWFNALPQLPEAGERHTRSVAEGEDLVELLSGVTRAQPLPWNRVVGRGPGRDRRRSHVSRARADRWAADHTSVADAEAAGRPSPHVGPGADAAPSRGAGGDRTASPEPSRSAICSPGGHEDVNDTSVPNGSSIAFLLEHRGASCLFGADAFPTVLGGALWALANARGGRRLAVDAVKLPHHGSQKNVGAKLLTLLSAKHFLISTNGERFGHPDDVSLARAITAAVRVHAVVQLPADGKDPTLGGSRSERPLRADDQICRIHGGDAARASGDVVTAEPERPSSQTLESWWAMQRVGRPGLAREQALDAARTDPPNAHIHLLDATCAALVAGEPRAAERLLDECEAAAPRDETWPRRIAACRAWAWTVDRLWYPGDVAAEIASAEDKPTFPRPQPGDQETQFLEWVANGLHSFLSLRWKAEWEVRRKPEKALAAVRKEGERLGPSPPPLARLEVAHLLDRAGKLDEATAMLADIRKQLENTFGSEIQDRVGLACTFLVEGDWYATPGSSPEALGFDLAITDAPSPFLDRRDLRRAAAAYDQAAAHLADIEEPRAQGALALRRAALAWLSRDYAAQQVNLRPRPPRSRRPAMSRPSGSRPSTGCSRRSRSGRLPRRGSRQVQASTSSLEGRSQRSFTGACRTGARAGQQGSAGCSSAPLPAGASAATTRARS